MTLYEALASEIEGSIRAGILRAGDRLPSVRRQMAGKGLSASTVFQAYYLLEARGLIQAKDRSGYFVGGSHTALPEPIHESAPASQPLALDIEDGAYRLIEASMSRAVIPFGSPFPSPSFFPLARLGKAMAESIKAMTPWSTVDDLCPGKTSLRRQIALRYAAAGVQVHPDEIVITNGALEALNLCLAAVTRPGDAVVIESPTFYGALQALKRLGLRAIEVPTHPRDGIDLSRLEEAVVNHQPSACWLMPTFQNPLGCTMPEEKKKALVALLARHGVPMIEDDVYSELYFADKRPLPAKAFDREGLVLHCSSFSKCLAPGYRIGWAAPGKFARGVARLKVTTSLGTSAPSQLGLARYLEQGGFDKHLRKLRQTLAQQHAQVERIVKNCFPRGSCAIRPLGGYFLWVELPPGVDSIDLHHQALQQDISIAPGPIFSARRDYRNCVRLNYGHALDKKGEQALELLGRLAAESEKP